MSLDERLRSGLRTMAEPVQDSERALHAFREEAYSRRARRRVLESVGAVVAAVAIVLGGTSVVRNLSNRPSGYVHRPPGMANCTNDDIRSIATYGAGPSMVIQYAWTSVHKACWVDDSVRLTISSNGPTHLPGAGVLSIQGNGSTVRLRGVVPAQNANGLPAPGASILGLRWEWTNWCGGGTSDFFNFKPLSDAFTYISRLDYAPANATCVDRSQPSVLRSLGITQEMNESSPFAG